MWESGWDIADVCAQKQSPEEGGSPAAGEGSAAREDYYPVAPSRSGAWPRPVLLRLLVHCTRGCPGGRKQGPQLQTLAVGCSGPKELARLQRASLERLRRRENH